ncbi:GNAT family N-acetyltransferase [Thalassolituus oleivorans]|uniref:N-acetyltransferase GCN5 n=1 Tax=Thalassolituus oleivorans MIL-1 TaxID=1298593 RepID=M5DQR9_9GAMM|nr:GNAT family protein [Thalassolituus oleivorans]CCU72285.1 N-acetyltransferase GCN5 [Thalassolituus oleivorans MIL-1]
MKYEEKILEGKYVRLEPLSTSHKEGLIEAISDGELWNLFVTLVPKPSDIDAFIDNAISAQKTGDGLAFATIDKQSGKVAGSTRFMKTDFINKRAEIGYTFLGKSYQKTRINTEAKLLMLTRLFESMSFNRVEIITDYLNSNSRNAILRLGAKEEGVLRNHMLMPDGRVRDSVLYSIIKNEWGGVKMNILDKLSSRA